MITVRKSSQLRERCVAVDVLPLKIIGFLHQHKLFCKAGPRNIPYVNITNSQTSSFHVSTILHRTIRSDIVWLHSEYLVNVREVSVAWLWLMMILCFHLQQYAERSFQHWIHLTFFSCRR